MPGQTRSTAATATATLALWTAFNGGPDNCPARPGAKYGEALGGEVMPPSMEGRTIARPDAIDAPTPRRAV